MEGQIAHPGTVTAVTPEKLTVGFTARSACASCHAAGLCTMSDVKEKSVEVANVYGGRYRVGDAVEVVFRASMGMKAVWLSYAIPVVILLGTVLGAIALGVSELWSGLTGIGVVALYYFVLWLFRKKLANTYIFTLK